MHAKSFAPCTMDEIFCSSVVLEENCFILGNHEMMEIVLFVWMWAASGTEWK